MGLKLQRGFVDGRSLLENVIENEHQIMTISLKMEKGTMVLVEFAAAFPSLSRDYLFEALTMVGVHQGL